MEVSSSLTASAAHIYRTGGLRVAARTQRRPANRVRPLFDRVSIACLKYAPTIIGSAESAHPNQTRFALFILSRSLHSAPGGGFCTPPLVLIKDLRVLEIIIKSFKRPPGRLSAADEKGTRETFIFT